MNYFNLYSSYPDDTIAAAWDSQVAEAAQTPWLKEELRRCDSDLFPPFAACYAELRALPRSARRALQRRIARSSELAAILPEWFRSGGGRALQYKLARSLAGAALLLALGQGIIEAATINVTTANPKAKRDGQCSLIEAIINANRDAAKHKDCPAGSGADTIVLPSSADITLNSVNNRTHGRTGLPVITSPITIEGNGAEIVGNNKNRKRPFRLIAVGDTGELTLQNVTLSGGSADEGGAILNHGTLAVENSIISGNQGGGVFNGATLTIQNSTISDNEGGGVTNTGTLTIENSTLSLNTSAGVGGGVSNFGSGAVSVKNSTISGNRAADRGGGIFNFNPYSSVSIENSIISGNHAVYSGGGIYNSGAVNVAGSTISGNSASRGGGAFNSRSYSLPASLSLTNSTISGNVASDDGGGIFNYRSYCGFYYCYFGGYLSLADSTITQNVAGDSGGGLFNEGTLSMTNSTISNNQAPNGPDIFP